MALKRLIWSLVRRRAFTYKITTQRGIHLTGNTKDWIQRNLYYFGVWEPNLTAWLEDRLLKGDVFVDVGANIGYFTLAASKMVGDTGSVVAVEAIPSIFEHLLAHVRANGLSNTRHINEAAVGPGAPAEVQLFLGEDANVGAASMIRGKGSSASVFVPARTLADMLTDDECRRARIIKIDVEGVEFAAVRGLGLESGRFSDQLELVVEVTSEREDLRERDGLMHYMDKLGFHAYLLREDHRFNRYADRSQTALRPMRLRESLSQVRNVVFSKTDTESL
jgi:FkbM family methyltransferase